MQEKNIFSLTELKDFQKSLKPQKTYNINRVPRKTTKTILAELGEGATRLSITRREQTSIITFEFLNAERKNGIEKHQYESTQAWYNKVKELSENTPENVYIDKSVATYLEKEPAKLAQE